jgi:hypothetical protein
VTTYLDAKDILAKDAFIEEYLNDVADPQTPRSRSTSSFSRVERGL